MKQQRGSALLLVLLVLGVLAVYFSLGTLGGVQAERDRNTSTALGQAREALIGFASGYRYLVNPNEVFGYLPCPDSNNSGTASPPCAAANVAVLGRFPWKTKSIAVAPLRDHSAQCLWYAVSGAAKDNPKTSPMNWDAPGQFVVQDATGTLLAGSTPHDRAWAVLLAPHEALTGQDRTATIGPATECGGNMLANNYLEGSIVLAGGGAISTLILGTAASRQAGINNDSGTWISASDIFDRLKKRSDFKADIDDMLGDLALCLNTLNPSDPALTASTGNKGVDQIISACPAQGTLKVNVLAGWRNNLLYAKPAAGLTVNGAVGCVAVLLFAGERTLRSLAPPGPQIRATGAQTGNATLFGDPAMYLEGANTVFPAGGAYGGAGFFDPGSASADVVRCIKGLPAGSLQESFAQDFPRFVAIGAGAVPDLAHMSVKLVNAVGAAGACFWSPTAVPLARKTLRAHHEFEFSFADDFALTGTGTDRGNGFSLQLVSADVGTAPSACGTGGTMGTLDGSDPWGANSIILETDVHRDAVSADLAGNHSAILLNGSIDHSQPGASMSPACDGTAAGCRHAPANLFEESIPTGHNQRLELHSGCNAGCSVCNPSAHAAPNDYLRVTVWVDCKDCNDVATDLDRSHHVPSLQRCITPNAALNSVYYGFTGGFNAGAGQQAVSLSHLVVRSE